MRVKLLNFSYLSLLKFIFIVSIFLAAVVIVYFPHYAKLKKLREANKQLLLQVKALTFEIKDLQAKLKKVGKDASLYEKLARDNLGVAKENEIVVDIKE
jgi:cell division protein FtsB